MTTSVPLRLLYDGDCPFCRREVHWLQKQDRRGHLVVEDIAAIGFDPAKYGLSIEQVQGSLHAIRPDGTVVSAMDAIRAAYEAVGLGWLVAPTRLPGARRVCDAAYRLFARNRVRWGNLLGRGCKRDCSTRFH